MSQLSLVLSLARREVRGGIKHFRVFLACLTLGVAAIAGVGSVSESILAGLDRDAQKLLGGDVDLRLLHRPATLAQKQYIAKSGASSEVIEMRAMAHAENTTATRKRALVELKAVDNSYPLVGNLELDEDAALSAALAREGNIWGAAVDRNLLGKLGLKLGDVVRIGDARFRLNATITREPDRVASVISFGPRIMVAGAALPETGLVQPGSQIRYRYRVLLPNSANSTDWLSALNGEFPKAGWRIRDRNQAAPGLQRFIDRMTLFLTFVGLTTLLVGGIGVTNAVQSYMEQKTATIATLKCLGGSGGQIFSLYLLQIIVLAVIGTILGVILGAAVPALAASALKGLLPVALEVTIFPKPLLLAAMFGILTAVTFALWPLAKARDVPAATLFRSQIVQPGGRPRASYLAAIAVGAMILAALTITTWPDRGFAVWFVAGAAATLLVLRGAASGVSRLAKHWGRWGNTDLRMAFANLHRPGAVTSSVMTSLGTGLSVLVAIALIQGNIGRQVDERLPDQAPAFFFIDIQPHQTANFDDTLKDIQGTGDLMRVASLRGRIVKIANVPVADRQISPGTAWAVRGDRALTFAAQPFEGAKIVAGEWWPENYSGPPLISLDANLARGFGVDIGDTLTLNVLGREIQAKITSLRSIDWRSMRFDFAIIFAPGTLDNAPHTHIAALQAPANIEDRVEQAISERFGNVSVIRVREALQAAADILASIGTAVRATAAITILAGGLVLAGAIATGRHRRTYDSVVFKVLGATRRRVLRTFLVEYGILGIVTGLVAAMVGSLTAYAVVVGLMDMDWTFLPQSVALTVLVAVIMTLIIGFAGTWRAMGQKAAPLLRNE